MARTFALLGEVLLLSLYNLMEISSWKLSTLLSGVISVLEMYRREGDCLIPSFAMLKICMQTFKMKVKLPVETGGSLYNESANMMSDEEKGKNERAVQHLYLSFETSVDKKWKCVVHRGLDQSVDIGSLPANYTTTDLMNPFSSKITLILCLEIAWENSMAAAKRAGKLAMYNQKVQGLQELDIAPTGPGVRDNYQIIHSSKKYSLIFRVSGEQEGGTEGRRRCAESRASEQQQVSDYQRSDRIQWVSNNNGSDCEGKNYANEMGLRQVKGKTLHPAEAATATDAVIASDTDRDEWCVMSVKDERLQQQSEKEASEHESHGTLVAVNSHDFPG
ncbi:hypothetical protein BTVI_156324 [Pitangus sulphuratus]|nr:hypothetical protein BTVI_156324 [Pitangus sulphuratus]